MAAPGLAYPNNPYKSFSPPTWEPNFNMQPGEGAAAPLSGGFAGTTYGVNPVPSNWGSKYTVQARRRGGRVGRTQGYGQGGLIGQNFESPTGGPGAAPALPGRIGYRGTLAATDGTGAPAASGIDWLHQGRTQSIANQGARHEIDPVTGLPVNATQREIDNQIQMLAGKGDEAGLEGKGVGGSKQAAAIGSYYNARASGDPAAIAAATNTVQSLKRSMSALRQGAQPPKTLSPTTPGQTVPPPMGNQQPNAAPTNEGTEETGYEGISPPGGDDMETGYEPKKKGGPVADVHPYEVNEEGPESVKFKGAKKPQLIPGGDHITTFPKDGTVIPHGRTMRLMQEGKVSMPEHRATGGPEHRSYKYITPNTHGGPLKVPTLEEEQARNIPANFHDIFPAQMVRNAPTIFDLFPQRSPLHQFADSMRNRAANFMNNRWNATTRTLAYPFVEPEDEQMQPEDYQPLPVAPTAPPPPMSTLPNDPDFEGEPIVGENEPPAEQNSWLTNILGNAQSPVHAAEQKAAANAANLATATNRLAMHPGTEQIGTLKGDAKSFLTPYGTVGINYRRKGGPVSRSMSYPMPKY